MAAETNVRTDPEPKAPRVQRQSRHTREVMLKHAAAIFAERGFRVTTLSDLAQDLDIAKATLFHHFRSKEDILFELYTRSMELALTRLRCVDAVDDEPIVVLRRLLREHTLLILENRALFTIFFREESELTEEHAAMVRVQQRDYINLIAARVSQLIESSIITRAVPPVIAVQIALGAGSYTYRWFEKDQHKSVEAVAAMTSDVMLDGLLS